MYYYFKKKEEILDVVLDEEMNEFYLKFKKVVEKEIDFYVKLKIYIVIKIKIVEFKVKVYVFLIENDNYYFDFNNYFKKMWFLYDDKELVLIIFILKYGVVFGSIYGDKLNGENV